MTNASIIIPVTVANDLLFYAATVCLRTCRATTDAEILVIFNNSKADDNTEALLDQCECLDIDYMTWGLPFSMSAVWNHGARETHNAHIVYAQQDIIFYPGWLNAILGAFTEHPQYRLFWPWSFDWRNFGTSTRKDYRNGTGLLDSDYPCGALSVHRRSDGYVWDERFSRWELDADFAYEMRNNRWKGACVLDSRVDHLVETISDHIDFEQHYGKPKDALHKEATEALKRKWNL